MIRVLIAEDEDASRRLLLTRLEKLGFEGAGARNGAEALRFFQEGDFPIIITDWVMPVMDGLELIRRIRAQEQAASDGPPTGRAEYAYIILVTAKSGREELVEGMEAGANDFISKPFDYEELRVRLQAGERIIRLERMLAERNQALRRAGEDLEARVRERTAELAQANERLRQAEVERKHFYREVIRAVTQDKFHLVDAFEIPAEGELALDAPLAGPEDYVALRKELQQLAARAGMQADDTDDFELAAGEAATNAIKHAAGARGALYLTPDRLIVRVSDEGPGIRVEDLPASILTPGFSTQISLGMGYTLMLRLADRVWLATAPEGTVVQLEKWIRPEEHEVSPALALLERL
jgi:DNA-binding response OmpR family regulator/anti-sigma regulatory factor (Ser/Thr protein kinase)